ncbi:hypothetical protein B0F90DRAFT_1823519 [Multifurca ochricompacta]|uniref:Uncharacterized protein n=1 Tax=Multifurca ochricompacta TaxID=376703 RepID=A0AAD4QHZ4_9AGAM|nr:hypothetical protein B0F90DRAFT_1823519 [Multifurca ochricompacta]
MVQARDVKPGLRSRGVKSLFDGFDGLFVKQACLKSGFKDSGFTGGFGFQVGVLYHKNGRSIMGIDLEHRRLQGRGSGFDVEVGLQETYPFKVGFWSGNQDHWHPGSIRWSTSTTIKPRQTIKVATKTESGSQDQDDDQDRSKESSRGHYVDHDGSRSQAAVSTSTTTKQGIEAAVSTSTTTKQGIEAAVSTSTATNQWDQYGSESSYQGQDDDQDKSGHQDQDGSSSGVGVRDASSSPHAFGKFFVGFG